MLPAPVGAPRAQAQAAAVEAVAGRGAGQRGGRLHLHGGDVEQGVAEARPVVGGVDAEDATGLACRGHQRGSGGDWFG